MKIYIKSKEEIEKYVSSKWFLDGMNHVYNTWQEVNDIDGYDNYLIGEKGDFWNIIIHSTWCYTEDEYNKLKQRKMYLDRLCNEIK